MLNLTLVALNGSPLWKVTPWRSLNSIVVWRREAPRLGQHRHEGAGVVALDQTVEERVDDRVARELGDQGGSRLSASAVVSMTRVLVLWRRDGEEGKSLERQREE